MSGRALLLIGSPRREESTSARLGDRLLSGLTARGFAGETRQLLPAWDSSERMAEVLTVAAAADLLLLSVPLYADHLPAPVIRFLERYAEQRPPGSRPQRMAALVHCGFPEATRNLPALDTLRLFCARRGIGFSGALAMGMGGALGGRRHFPGGGRARKQPLLAIDRAADALAAGEAIPAECERQAGRPLMARWLYLLGGNWGWKRRALRLGIRARLYDRPYA